MLDVKKVGLKISSLRKSIGFSQEKLAELLSVTPQAERIANVVFAKMEDKQKSKEQLGFTDEEITEAVITKHPDIDRIMISRGKTSRTTGDICTPIFVSSSTHEINLLETIYHKQSRKENIFDSYVLLNDCGVKELRNLYGIDCAKSAILAENVIDECFDMNEYSEDTAGGEIIRKNYNAILRSVADWHGTMWDNHSAFGKIGLPPHFETKENMLAWISSAMERPYRKYRKAEETGKIPKVINKNWSNDITEEELDYYKKALTFLKTEYIKLVDERFNEGKNITIVHGDLHPGRIWLFKDLSKAALIAGPEPARIGLCTDDLAMLTQSLGLIIITNACVRK